jgi:hypothetical protein
VDGRPPPILVLNPANDEQFAERARALLDHARTPGELQAALLADHPQVIVRSRDLAGEDEAWYVYRDGHWVPSTNENSGG